MKILIGTNNKGKLATYERAFKRQVFGAEIVCPQDLLILEEPEENEKTLLENAEKKAIFYGEKSGLVTLADDTGLFVDALNGEPGLHAARWHQGSEEDRSRALLKRLQGIPFKKRTARFIGLVVCYNPSTKKFWSYEGRIEGWISNEFKGNNGFGYDQIFLTKDYKRHMAELNDEELASIGYREIAIVKMLKERFLDRSGSE